MPTFDVGKYSEKKQWKNDEYLVNGDEGFKKCFFCQEIKYTVEFPNVLEYEDGKLPLCVECFKKEKNQDEIKSFFSINPVRRGCKECEIEKELSEFSYTKTRNGLNEKCKSCVGVVDFSAIFKREN
jgi:protein-arginine kinase activator protein McsA